MFEREWVSLTCSLLLNFLICPSLTVCECLLHICPFDILYIILPFTLDRGWVNLIPLFKCTYWFFPLFLWLNFARMWVFILYFYILTFIKKIILQKISSKLRSFITDVWCYYYTILFWFTDALLVTLSYI
jgi:hypothetical protein